MQAENRHPVKSSSETCLAESGSAVYAAVIRVADGDGGRAGLGVGRGKTVVEMIGTGDQRGWLVEI